MNTKLVVGVLCLGLATAAGTAGTVAAGIGSGVVKVCAATWLPAYMPAITTRLPPGSSPLPKLLLPVFPKEPKPAPGAMPIPTHWDGKPEPIPTDWKGVRIILLNH